MLRHCEAGRNNGWVWRVSKEWRHFAEPNLLRHRRRRSILTKEVMAGIPALVQQGWNAAAIAAQIGCSVGTLKVRCSQAQISLRVPKAIKMVPLVPSPKPLKLKKSTTLRLSQVAMSRLRRHAEAIGVNETS